MEQAQEQIRESKFIGVATSRIDGPLKTTGNAMYSSDHHFPGLVYAWPSTATIASGTIKSIDTSVAEKMPGVIAIYHHDNIGPLYRTPPAGDFSMIVDEKRPPLEDTTVRYYGQYVAVALASTVEQGSHQARRRRRSTGIGGNQARRRLQYAGGDAQPHRAACHGCRLSRWQVHPL
jgi:xanthine dehydrogenase YagR molybdenum-binding subunit